MSQTRAKFEELLTVLGEASARYGGEEWGVTDQTDVAEAHRILMHILQSALFAHAEFDADRPAFKRIVSPTRKFTGDNADAIYFESEVSAANEYLVRGNIAGAAYTSFTVELGAREGKYATATGGVLNDGDMDIAADGSYEIRLGGEARDRNWLDLPDDAGRITTRHYFEFPVPAAADQELLVPLSIHNLTPASPPPPPDDAIVANQIQRVINHVAGKTIQQPVPGTYPMPSWVSKDPNWLPDPEPPSTMAFAAFDASYSMGVYELAPDEALVMTGRWPECRFGNVCLWNRFGQTYDYSNRPVARNRANTTLNDDGSFTMVIAHEDPGTGNWLDTEGRRTGQIFWRFFLPEGDVDRIECAVVKLADLKG